MIVSERELRDRIRKILVEASAVEHGLDDTEEVSEMMRDKYGLEVPSDWVDKAGDRGYLSEPRVLSDELVISSGLSVGKEVEPRELKDEFGKRVRREVGVPYILPDLKSRDMSEYSKKLKEEGFERVAVFVLVKSETSDVDEVKVGVHYYLNRETKKVAFPKIKNQGWSRASGLAYHGRGD
jgi:hypothetical protein